MILGLWPSDVSGHEYARLCASYEARGAGLSLGDCVCQGVCTHESEGLASPEPAGEAPGGADADGGRGQTKAVEVHSFRCKPDCPCVLDGPGKASVSP